MWHRYVCSTTTGLIPRTYATGCSLACSYICPSLGSAWARPWHGQHLSAGHSATFLLPSCAALQSSLAAQWQGGFCQRTCQRCDCSPGSGIVCSMVQSPDIMATNGVIHGISRVLFPPPIFTKEQAIQQAIAYNESLSRNQSLGIAPAPGMTGLNELPGAAAPLTPTAPVAGATPAAAGNATGPVTAPAAGNATGAAGTASNASAALPSSAGRRRLSSKRHARKRAMRSTA